MDMLRMLTSHPQLLVQPSIVFVVTFAAGYIARALLLRALRAWIGRTGARAGQIVSEALRSPTVLWAVILALHVAIQSSELPHAVTARWAPGTLVALWGASFTLMLMRVAGDMVRHFGAQIPGALPVTALTQTLAQLAVLILGIVLVLWAEDVQVTPILTALGVGGLAVALALQDTLSNLFAGFYMAVARQINVGDYVKLNTGEEGYVVDITWRSTTFRALANNLIIVPNAKLAQAIVTNYYMPEKRMSASVQVGVSYAADPDHVERVLLDVATRSASEIPGMVADAAPSIQFDPGFGDSSLGFTVNYQVSEFSQQFGVRAELRKRILRRLREEGIDIPFPTRTVLIESAPRAEGHGAEPAV
jgi:small-conductance mechanosensitive channel